MKDKACDNDGSKNDLEVLQQICIDLGCAISPPTRTQCKKVGVTSPVLEIYKLILEVSVRAFCKHLRLRRMQV